MGVIVSERRKGFTTLDAVVTIFLAGILIGYFIPRYYRVAREAKEVALKSTLLNIRVSIRLYKALNERYPRSLNELMEKQIILPGRIGKDPFTGSIFNEKYLIPHVLDKSGNLIDPFGNPFVYDFYRGEVKSTTKGYEAW